MHFFIIFAIIILIILFVMDRLGPISRLGIWLGSAALLLPVWIANAQIFDIEWVLFGKALSVLAGLLWIEWGAWRLANQPARLAAGLRGFLILNIVEAAGYDALVGNWINGSVGFALAGLVMLLPQAYITSVSRGVPSLVLPAGWPFIMAYTLWNITFVAGVAPQAFGEHIAVLSAPLLASCFIRQDRGGAWMRFRAATLWLYLVLLMTFYGAFRHSFNSAGLVTQDLYFALCLAAVLSCLWAAFTLTRSRYGAHRSVPAR